MQNECETKKGLKYGINRLKIVSYVFIYIYKITNSRIYIINIYNKIFSYKKKKSQRTSGQDSEVGNTVFIFSHVHIKITNYRTNINESCLTTS